MRNNKITIYYLINMIRLGFAPRRIKINNQIWYLYLGAGMIEYSLAEDNNTHTLDWNYYVEHNKLNDEVQIIGDIKIYLHQKIEKEEN